MFFDVTSAEHAGDYRIRLRFRDGSGGVADLSAYAGQEQCRSVPSEIRSTSKHSGWSTGRWSGALAMSTLPPEALYERATGRTVRYDRQKTAV